MAGALRVYWRGLVQLVFPYTLSGDYSYPQEPIPDRTVFPESVLGAAGMVFPPIAAFVLWIRAMVHRRRATRVAAMVEVDGPRTDDARLAGVGHALLALALVWIVVSYFPHSNIPVLLPTVRAERFLYFPAMGRNDVRRLRGGLLRQQLPAVPVVWPRHVQRRL